MDTTNKLTVNGVEIDSDKVTRLLIRPIATEKNNIQTKQHNGSQMITIIQRMIEEEVQCY